MNSIDTTSGFSRLRLEAVCRYYLPIVKWQMIIYVLIAMLCAVLELLPVGTVMQFSLFTTVWATLPFMFMLAALVFARNGDSRMVECQIPATAAEKFTFFTIYLLVVIPLLVYVIPESALWLYTQIPAVQTDLMMSLLDMRFKLAPGLLSINILSSVCGAMTCLCVVLRAKSNRILKAVIAVLAVQFMLALMGGAYGMVTAIQNGLEDGYAGLPPNASYSIKTAIDMRMQEAAAGVAGAWVFQLVVGAILTVYIIWILRTIYKTLRRGDCCL